MLSIAAALSEHLVTIFSDIPSLIPMARERFNLDISHIHTSDPLDKTSRWRRLRNLRNQDVLFFLSDGSLPLPIAKKTYIHFQFPVQHEASFYDHLKCKLYAGIICNSHFTKSYIDATYGRKSSVVYPPVQMIGLGKNKSPKHILSVGRFTTGKNKKQFEVLIESFNQLCAISKGWSLTIAGGAQRHEEQYVKQLQELAKGNRIRFVINPSFYEIVSLYQQSEYYWHAAGFGIDEHLHPDQVEHFGITTVEAMSAGCIPFVFPAGGQKEIVKNGSNGMYWQDPEELVGKTIEVGENKHLYHQLLGSVLKDCEQFSYEQFSQAIHQLVLS